MNQNGNESNDKYEHESMLHRLPTGKDFLWRMFVFIVPLLIFVGFILYLPSYVVNHFIDQKLNTTGWIIYGSTALLLVVVAQLGYAIHQQYALDRRVYTTQKTYRQMAATLRSLDKSAAKYNTVGNISALLVFVSVLVFGAVVHNLFESTTEMLQEHFNVSSTSVSGIQKGKAAEHVSSNGSNVAATLNSSDGKMVDKAGRESRDSEWLIAIIYILRTSLLGTFIIAFIKYTFKFVASSFDQAVRFKKRKHAGLFLLQLMESSTNADIQTIMEAFKEWNLSVESAYTANAGTSVDRVTGYDKSEEYLKKIIDKLEKK